LISALLHIYFHFLLKWGRENSLKTDFWRAAKLLLAQILNLDINEQLAREVDYLRAENQVLKSQLKEIR